MEGGMISVDRWSKGSSAYFLTHLHSDHTRGLSSTWRNGPLYCSRTTAKLFPLKFPDFDLSLLRVVDIGSWLKLSLSSSVHVMPIHALHCPGAVMFLFRGDFGHVLYTGDFRWEINGVQSENARNMLFNALNGQILDVLYLDNTYCNPAYCFPTRNVAAQQVIDIITSYPDHDIIIGIDSLGKEDLLISIAESLNIKIWVWPERLQTMHLLGLPDIFTTRTCLTRVRAVPRYSFSIDTLEALNKRKPTIGIMPSGLPWLVKSFAGEKQSSASSCLTVDSTSRRKALRDGTRVDLNMKSVEKVHQYVYSVPYSEHSCFPEIKHFYSLLQPSHVKGIVTVSAWYVDPVYYLGHLLKTNLANEMNSLNLETHGEVESKLKMKNKNFKTTGKKYRSSDKFTSGVQVHRVNLQRKTRGIRITECDDFDFPAGKT
ncbi:uncharacterized protein LOC141640487 [Silene latifolia]|uniref:uncharacterized protein LOC141640487 n=1 Tax=Silene latifolia TaxID=37657 RepID=UPI003D789DA2